MEQQRLVHEHQEAERLLTEQRAIIAELEKIRTAETTELLTAAADLSGSIADCGPSFEQFPRIPDLSNLQSEIRNRKSEISTLPERLIAHYRELLRAYVVMGAGNLADEMASLASMLTEADVSAQSTMQLHVKVLEELIASLGNRSARHVMSRADLLVLEIMAHLADGYRRRYHDEHRPTRPLDPPSL